RIHAGNPPSFVVADIVMPGMSGLDLYARAVSLSDGWRKRFVFVTGSDRFAAAGESWNVPVLQKPVSIERLHAIIAERSVAA
ncbi:MAG TPA: DNA-binding response regulator, partial [Myxococcota bacterium]|nr:DNA-binding response regulator [Myxococcota bacterium]